MNKLGLLINLITVALAAHDLAQRTMVSVATQGSSEMPLQHTKSSNLTTTTTTTTIGKSSSSIQQQAQAWHAYIHLHEAAATTR